MRRNRSRPFFPFVCCCIVKTNAFDQYLNTHFLSLRYWLLSLRYFCERINTQSSNWYCSFCVTKITGLTNRDLWGQRMKTCTVYPADGLDIVWAPLCLQDLTRCADWSKDNTAQTLRPARVSIHRRKIDWMGFLLKCCKSLPKKNWSCHSHDMARIVSWSKTLSRDSWVTLFEKELSRHI